MENLCRVVNQASEWDICSGGIVSYVPSAVVHTELIASDVDMQSLSPKLHTFPFMKAIHSSPKFAEAACLAESPRLPPMEDYEDTWIESSEMEASLKPVATEFPPSIDMETGVNDLFWKQFFTEAPASSKIQVVR